MERGMRSTLLILAVVLAWTAGTCLCSPDIKELKIEQQELLHNIQRSQIESERLKEQLDQLQQSRIGNNHTLNVSKIVVDSSEDGESKEKGEMDYTAPIIIMLPEEPSDREKWEYAITIRCLGQKDFSVFDRVHNSKLLEMSNIKGKTMKEIQEEIKATEKELKETQNELKTLQATLSGLNDLSYGDRTKKMQVLHNIKLVKHEVDVLETKLNRLHKRLKAAVLFSSHSSEKSAKSSKSDKDDEQDDENDATPSDDAEPEEEEGDEGED